ncbi:PfkB family carbohydrate kinase [Photobacterium damselae]|uniref:PfkB family carbohydrate kinase n=1 Tax=Photobacterium damselae TaxID=38293 RepID=UPI0015A3921C|nr:PfkB family carbohydrate kinase [Photobacterium damselae]NVO60750.1 ribokinase [Photobacterium damselae subsp. damselae]
MIDILHLHPTRPVIVIGAAFGDLMLEVDQLPTSGADIEANEMGQHIGGCAFNVARALSRLSIPVINGISIGNGKWGQAIEQEMEKEHLSPLIFHPTRDNGWCIALVDKTKERTFITVNGCEQEWSPELLAKIPTPDNAIIYVSGYELVGTHAQPLQQWLLSQTNDKTLYLDLGPRINELSSEFLIQLIEKQPILTLNRDELAMLMNRIDQQEGDNVVAAHFFANQHNCQLICRFDCEGATVCEPDNIPMTEPAFQVEVADTIAAGDSHCAGVIAGLASGLSLVESTRLGNMVAAIVVSKVGSDGAPTRDELAIFAQNQ